MLQIIETLTSSVLNALWIIGVWNAFLPGQILGELGDFMAGNTKVIPPIERNLPTWFTKPLFECPMCCASFHGALWWLLFQPVPWYLLPIYVVCLSGFMKIISILVLDKDS